MPTLKINIAKRHHVAYGYSETTSSGGFLCFFLTIGTGIESSSSTQLLLLLSVREREREREREGAGLKYSERGRESLEEFFFFFLYVKNNIVGLKEKKKDKVGWVCFTLWQCNLVFCF